MVRGKEATIVCALLTTLWLGAIYMALAQTPAPERTEKKPPAEAPKNEEPATVPAVWAEPNPALPGQTVTFGRRPDVWKVIASGGAFGARKAVLGPEELTDTPKKPTVYRFEVWTRAKPAGGGASVVGHTKQTITVDVYTGQYPPIVPYHDTRGWRIDTLKEWHNFDIPQDDPKRNALMFFEAQEDAAERVAVAILPVSNLTADGLMDKAMDDAPTQYDVLKDVTRKEITQAGEPAVWVTFSGIDRALPGIGLRAMVMTLVHDGLGYVISTRSSAGQFDETREHLLRCLVRSFAFEKVEDHRLRGDGRKRADARGR